MRTSRGKEERSFDIVIVGGLGHAGFPLGLVFADKAFRVCLYDIDSKKADLVKKKIMPFMEYGGEPILRKVIDNGRLRVSTDIKCVSKARYVIIAIGTPIDEYLNPKVRSFLDFFSHLKRYIHRRQTIIVRSTVYPHTCRQMFKMLGDEKGWDLAYCPERIVQGHAVKELVELPQVVAGMTEEAAGKAAELFSRISPKIIRVSMEEAELIKLFTNTWRYIQFAIANQFYMIAHSYGVDYDRVRRAMVEGYNRAATLPSAGFTAGPCLLKDTMQLVAFYGNNFQLGHASMMINEGLPGYIVDDLRKRYDLGKISVGILGMAFKADIDDIRDSLSYKLRKILQFHGAKVLCSDEYAKNAAFISRDSLVASSDVIIIGVPHSAYKTLAVPKKVEVVDLWGITKK